MKVFFNGFFEPKYATKGSAGLDLANNTMDEDGFYKDILIKPGETVKIDTKVHLEIPRGYVGLLFVRSSLGYQGLDLVNSVAVIDSDYRGEIGLKFLNRGKEPIDIFAGRRVAQIVIVPYYKARLRFMPRLSDLESTDRGEKGFGSSGEL